MSVATRAVRSTPHRWAVAGIAAAMLLSVFATIRPAGAAEVVVIEVLSGRGDLVSGGDALLRVTVPGDASADDLTVDDDGRDVTSAFVTMDDGSAWGLVTGLDVGTNRITAELPDGLGAFIDLTNAPQSGPVFSGPLIEPWTCTNEDAQDADCTQEPVVNFHYVQDGDPSMMLQAYDPENPPADVAMVTTDEGNEVPFIVREELGYSLRDQYAIAALWDPALGDQPDPTAENPGYANKLVLTHGASCDTSYESGSAPDVLLTDALSQGFAVASHALDNAGHNCNMVTQAESLIMTKEMVVERFGPIRYTIGSGCSGGSLVQQQVANAYPGVYQGITPQCSFTDAWSSAQQYVDFVGLRNYFEGPEGALFTENQKGTVYGHASSANATSFTTAIPNSGEPTRECPGVPAEDVYDEDANSDGVRCTFQDYMVNVFGVDAQGFARRPIGNVGVQYGLSSLFVSIDPTIYDGDTTRSPITAEQFVLLNEGVGGFDIDFDPIEERTVADPIAQDRVYRSGAVNTGAHLDEVAIIDLGGPEPGAFHDVYRKYSMRDRLIREHGTAENQVFWEGQTPLLGDPAFADDSITAMDEWLQVVEADTRDVPLAQKIIDAKEEAGIGYRCVDGSGNDAPDESVCDGVDQTLFSSPRIEAGGGDPLIGFTDDRLECELIALEDHDYAGQTFEETFTEDQQDRLRVVFPDGVCDYTRPGKGFQAATTWLTYQDADGTVIHGGEPMGTAPVSVPFGPDAAVGGSDNDDDLAATGGGAVLLAVAAIGGALVIARLRRRES